MVYKVRVTEIHDAKSGEPLTALRGDEVALGWRDDEWPGWIWATNARGESGWIPEAYIEISGSTGHFLRDYTTRELSARPGDELTVTDGVADWLWVHTSSDEAGWIPEFKTERIL